MVVKTIPTTEEVKDILDRYDINSLLKTVPNDYNFSNMKQLKERMETLMITTTTIEVTDETITYLNSIAQNYKMPIPIIITFLVENVCDCGKVQTKKITRALNNYYEITTKAVCDQDQNARRLFIRLLNEYSESVFYDEQTGLSEKGIANFLTMSREGQALVNDMELYNKQ